jgi:hypothetical protein
MPNENVIEANVVHEETAKNNANVLQTESAFLMYLDKNGHWIADGNLDREVQTARSATVDDFFHACAVVSKDLTVADTTRQMLLAQQQIAQQMAQQMETQKIVQATGANAGAGFDLSKLKL